MKMSAVLMTMCQCVLLVGLIKATCSTIDDQNVNLIDCSRKNLTSMPVFLHISTTQLILRGNYLQVVPAWSFQKSKHLKRLDLSNNLLRIIERGAFAGLAELTYLNLRTNKLASNSLHEKIFQDLISLQNLAIYDNLFNDEYTFLQVEISRVRSLNTLGIDLRDRHQINKCLCDLSKLKDLEIFGMHREAYSDNSFNELKCLKIEALYMSLEGVVSLASDAFISFSKLKTLRLSIMSRLADYNTIDSIFKSFKVFKGTNMTEISITSNPHIYGFVLGHRHFAVLQEICLRKLNLMGDSILGIQLGPFLKYGYTENCLEELNIDLMFGSRESYVFAFCAFKHLKIIRTPHVIVRDKRVKRSSENDVSYSFCIPKTLEQLDFHSHVRLYNSRRIANLTIINGSNLKIVNMANITLRDCDGTIYGMENLEHLDISGFICKVLSVNLLEHFPKLTTLIAQDSYLGIGLNSFKNASEFLKMNLDLQRIDLTKNCINSLPNDLFHHPFRQTLSIILDKNNLQSLPNFPPKPNTIQQISLKYNRFSCLSDDNMALLNIIKPSRVFLLGNPIECSCNTLRFLKWVNRSGFISDVNEIECVLQNGTLAILSHFLRNLKTYEISCQTELWITLASSITSFTILALIFGIVYYRYRFAFEYFFLRIKMKLRLYQPLLEEFNYDAFISYSHYDKTWVKSLHDRLQTKGFSFCLDDKDFLVGVDIAECVVKAINSSRKVIFVITEDFLKSSWGTYEVEMTRMHAFREGRESMVIVILMYDIKKDKLPKALKEIWYKVVCIVWPSDTEAPYNSEEIFYEKLSIALTDGRTQMCEN